MGYYRFLSPTEFIAKEFISQEQKIIDGNTIVFEFYPTIAQQNEGNCFLSFYIRCFDYMRTYNQSIKILR